MLSGLLDGEGSANETDLAMIRKVGRDVTAAIGPRHLAIAAQIDAAQHDLTAMGIAEITAIAANGGEGH
jgi:hypothetical protein